MQLTFYLTLKLMKIWLKQILGVDLWNCCWKSQIYIAYMHFDTSLALWYTQPCSLHSYERESDWGAICKSINSSFTIYKSQICFCNFFFHHSKFSEATLFQLDILFCTQFLYKYLREYCFSADLFFLYKLDVNYVYSLTNIFRIYCFCSWISRFFFETRCMFIPTIISDLTNNCKVTMFHVYDNWKFVWIK